MNFNTNIFQLLFLFLLLTALFFFQLLLQLKLIYIIQLLLQLQLTEGTLGWHARSGSQRVNETVSTGGLGTVSS